MNITDVPRAPSPLDAVRIGRFGFLVSIQLGNAIGVWMHVLAAQWLLTERRESAVVIGLVPAAVSIPFLVLALPMGVIAGYARREAIMAAAMALAAGASAVACVLAWTGRASAWTLVVSVIMIGIGLVSVGIAWQSLLPETLEPRLVGVAAVVDGAVFNSARAIGPVIAGIGLSLTSASVVFAVNAVLFGSCAIAMTAAGRRWPSRTRPREPLVAAMAGGLRFARHSPWTRRLLVRMVAFGLPSSCLWALLSLVAHDRLHLGSTGFGLMSGMLGVGAVAGSFAVAPLRRKMSVSGFAVVGSVAYAVVLLILATVSSPGLVMLFLVLGGAAWVGVQSTWMMLSHQALPDWVRHRTIAMILFLFQGTQAAGAVLWGALADAVGLSSSIACAAAMMLLSAVAMGRRGLHASAGIEPVPSGSPAPAAIWSVDADEDLAIEITYTVRTEAVAEFRAAMEQLRRSRLRLGAHGWRLLRDPETTSRFVESYLVRSWSEHVAQETERLTHPELRLRQAIDRLADQQTSPRYLVVDRPTKETVRHDRHV